MNMYILIIRVVVYFCLFVFLLFVLIEFSFYILLLIAFHRVNALHVHNAMRQ